MNEALRVLLLEDDANDAELILHAIGQSGFEPDWRRVELESEFLAALDSPFDLILADDHAVVRAGICTMLATLGASRSSDRRATVAMRSRWSNSISHTC